MQAPASGLAGKRHGRHGNVWEIQVMETVKQVSVFLENKPGRLAQVLSALAREKVNITALSVMDSHEHSVLRLVSDNAAKTEQVLQGLGARHTAADVLLVELKNHPGALAHVCEVLAGEHVNIDYAYCSSGGRNGRVMGVFKVSNTEKAMRVLSPAANNSRGRRIDKDKRPARDRRAYTARNANSM
jgi:hypothetical protein